MSDQTVLRVVRGEPTEEELAAVVTAITTRRRVARPPGTPVQGQWRARGRNVRPALSPGPRAWYASGLPR